MVSKSTFFRFLAKSLQTGRVTCPVIRTATHIGDSPSRFSTRGVRPFGP